MSPLRSYHPWARRMLAEEHVNTLPSRQFKYEPGGKLNDLLNQVTALETDKSNNVMSMETKMKSVDLIFKAMERLGKLGFLLSYEQSIVVKAMIRAYIPQIFGEQMIAALPVLARKYGMLSFKQFIAVLFGRRRGKSKAVGYFHAVMLASQPKFYGFMINLHQRLAAQNLTYAKEFINMLASDPEHVIHCHVKSMDDNYLHVVSHHGTVNTLFASPNIELSDGTVSMTHVYVYI